MKSLRWALRYAELGFPVFPLGPRSKIPLKDTRGFHEASTDPKVVEGLWGGRRGLNVGIAVPPDYVVVDVDDEEALRALSAQDVELPATVRAKTGRGYHFWYRCGNREFAPKVDIFDGVDIRAVGSYVVAPPSVHENGRTYEWLVPPKPSNFAPRPDWLTQVSAQASREEREPLQAEEVLSGIEHGSRDITLFRYACQLRQRGLSRGEAEALVLHAAANCHPPFPQKEALIKVAGAWRYRCELEERRRETSRGWRLDEFMRAEFAPPRYFVESILPEGLSLVCSPAKVGKSFLMGHIAFSVAVGGSALGYLNAQRSGVLYLDLEQGEGQAQNRWRQIIGDDAPSNLHLFFEWPRIGDGCLKKLEEFLSNEPTVGLVVVDVLSLVWPIDSKRGMNAYHAEYEVLTRLKSVAKRWGVAIMLVHHTNRGNHDDILHSVSGTNAMTGVPDAVWMLTRARGKTFGRLFVTGRSVAEFDEPLLWDPTLGLWTLDRGIDPCDPFTPARGAN